MAKQFEVSTSTVQRIWQARGLKPHRVDTFKLSSDPAFEEKLTDVVGVLEPAGQAVVLCLDEESSVHALDRTQASLPMKKGLYAHLDHLLRTAERPVR